MKKEKGREMLVSFMCEVVS